MDVSPATEAGRRMQRSLHSEPDLGVDRDTYDDMIAAIEQEVAAIERRRVVERIRQVHARHDLGHQLGAWPHACAVCEAVAILDEVTTP